MNKKIKIQIKNRFTGNVIFEYEKKDNTIKDTVEEAVKNGASLNGASLEGASLDKRYISVARIGKRKDIATYCFEDDIIWCGCWIGNLEDFEKRVKETHANNEQYLKEYLGFIEYLKSLK